MLTDKLSELNAQVCSDVGRESILRLLLADTTLTVDEAVGDGRWKLKVGDKRVVTIQEYPPCRVSKQVKSSLVDWLVGDI